MWATGFAVVGAAIAVVIAWGPLEGIAHVQDEIVYELQARHLAEGRLWEPERTPRAAHHFEFVINADGRRYGIFPVGWPLVLALGTLFGAPLLVNPILHAVTVLVGASLARRVAGVSVGAVAAPLLAVNPGLLLQAASRMSHTLSALLTLSAFALALGAPSRKRGVALGTLLGWLLLTRPLDALVASALVALTIGLAHRTALREAKPFVFALVPLAAFALVLGAYNTALEGHPLTFPQTSWFARGEPPALGDGQRYDATCNRLGFGPGHGCRWVAGTLDHTLARGLSFVWENWRLTPDLWFGGRVPALFVLPALVTPRGRKLALLALGTWLALSLSYSLYWYHGAAYGPRFHHSAAPLAVLAFAAGAARTASLLRLPFVVGLALTLPLGHVTAESARELRGYWGVDGRVHALVDAWDRGPALVAVAYGPHPWVPAYLPKTSAPDTAFDAVLRRGMWIETRSPALEFAEYQPALHDELLRRAAGRPAYLLVLHDHPGRDYLVPFARLAKPEGQRRDLPLPQPLPYYREPLEGAEPIAHYYARRSSPRASAHSPSFSR